MNPTKLRKVKTVSARIEEPGMARVILESGSIGDLLEREATSAALEAGSAAGLGSCGLDSATSPYPVLRDGRACETDEDFRIFEQEAAAYTVAGKYRRDFLIRSSVIQAPAVTL